MARPSRILTDEGCDAIVTKPRSEDQQQQHQQRQQQQYFQEDPLMVVVEIDDETTTMDSELSPLPSGGGGGGGMNIGGRHPTMKLKPFILPPSSFVVEGMEEQQRHPDDDDDDDDNDDDDRSPHRSLSLDDTIYSELTGITNIPNPTDGKDTIMMEFPPICTAGTARISNRKMIVSQSLEANGGTKSTTPQTTTPTTTTTTIARTTQGEKLKTMNFEKPSPATPPPPPTLSIIPPSTTTFTYPPNYGVHTIGLLEEPSLSGQSGQGCITPPGNDKPLVLIEEEEEDKEEEEQRQQQQQQQHNYDEERGAFHDFSSISNSAIDMPHLESEMASDHDDVMDEEVIVQRMKEIIQLSSSSSSSLLSFSQRQRNDGAILLSPQQGIEMSYNPRLGGKDTTAIMAKMKVERPMICGIPKSMVYLFLVLLVVIAVGIGVGIGAAVFQRRQHG